MKWVLSLIVCISLIFVSVFWGGKMTSVQKRGGTTMTFENGAQYDLEIADTEEKRVKGLSGTVSLGEKNALLFSFEKSGFWGIWMKDMNFPIDIIWLDSNKKIVHVIEGAIPESYPHIFYPDTDALYVIELNSGVVSREGLEVGQTIIF